jgi:curved DNA-binding protein CbpA
MQIPLDYYRILGIPIQAESTLIQQAYEDSIEQLPHNSYTSYGINSRKNLITKAYQVLINPDSRLDYESSFFQYQRETSRGEIFREVNIDIDKELFVGALILLLNLGEYELILHLAKPYLRKKDFAQESLINDDERETSFSQLWQDLILTFILANLELAREKWHDNSFDSAANCLQDSCELLTQEDFEYHEERN